MIAWMLLLSQSAPVSAPADAVPHAPESAVARIEPFDGPFGEGLAEIRRLANSGAIDEAVLVAEQLAVPNALARKVEELLRADGWRASVGRALASAGDALDLIGPPPVIRAEAQYARATALALGSRRAVSEDERALRREQSLLAFESARLMAGPGTLRLDATYEQGNLAFAAGEEQRAELPEISGQPAQPPPPPPVAAQPGAAAPEPPDPLQLARAAYLAARERYLERLRMDWRDADTQANVELCQRRLRELDEIERQRQQEKQEQEQKDESKDEEQKDDEKQDPKDSQDEKSDEPQSDEPKPKDPSEDPAKDPEPDEEPADPKDEPTPEDSPKPEPKPIDPKDLPKMSKEEMLQLLQRLEKIEDVQKELQEKLKRMRRVGVEKDW